MKHRMASYDPDDGSPYYEPCECGIGEDHTVADFRAYVDEMERETALLMEDQLRERLAREREGDGGPIQP